MTTMISPGTQGRVSLLSSITCVALVTWLLIRSGASTSEPPLTIRSEASRVSRLEALVVYCYVELYLLRDIAKKKLDRADANAAAVGLAAVPIPQPS